MKTTTIFSIIVLLLPCALTYAQSPESFFPYHVGDTWQYTLDNTNIIYGTDIIVADSTDSTGTVYLKYDGDNFYRFYIDTSYNVYWAPGGGSYAHLYKLDADSSESWWYSEQQVRASVVDIYSDTFWGISATVKVIEYWLILPGDSLWLATRFLANGFGLVAFWGEPGPFHHLSGAVIDSVLYGFVVSIDEPQTKAIAPKVIELYQNYPNPFNPNTTIEYQLSRTFPVYLQVFNSLGQQVKTLVNETQPPGSYQVRFDGSKLPSGVYYYRIQAGDFSNQKKMLLIK